MNLRKRMSGAAGTPQKSIASDGRKNAPPPPSPPPPNFLGVPHDQQIPVDMSAAEKLAERGSPFSAARHGDPRLRRIFDAVREAPQPPCPGRLNLSHDEFGDEGARCLGAALKGLHEPLRLSSIGVASCGLTANGVQAVVGGLLGRTFHGRGLRVLNASGNSGLGDDGVVALLGLALPTLEVCCC